MLNRGPFLYDSFFLLPSGITPYGVKVIVDFLIAKLFDNDESLAYHITERDSRSGENITFYIMFYAAIFDNHSVGHIGL